MILITELTLRRNKVQKTKSHASHHGYHRYADNACNRFP